MHHRARAVLAQAVLNGFNLLIVPVGHEGREDTAVIIGIPVVVSGPFPDAHRGQTGRLQAGHMPLIDGVIGNPVQTDFSSRPGLDAGPFDAGAEILGLARGTYIDNAR